MTATRREQQTHGKGLYKQESVLQSVVPNEGQRITYIELWGRHMRGEMHCGLDVFMSSMMAGSRARIHAVEQGRAEAYRRGEITLPPLSAERLAAIERQEQEFTERFDGACGEWVSDPRREENLPGELARLALQEEVEAAKRAANRALSMKRRVQLPNELIAAFTALARLARLLGLFNLIGMLQELVRVLILFFEIKYQLERAPPPPTPLQTYPQIQLNAPNI